MSLSGAQAILDKLPSVFRDQYRVIEILGQGATSMAVRARQHEPQREVVIKVLLCDDAESRARFLIEAKALAELDHPNVVRLFGSGESEDLLYMVLEFLPGRTLQQRMKDSPPTSVELRTLSIGIAAGLEAIHAKSILHRDIKPANIWCLEDGTPQLLDFGLARQGEGAGVTQLGVRLGTPGYASPEQIRGDPVDAGTDIYSMGLIFYEMVTGAHPSERRPGDSNSIRIRLEKGNSLIVEIPTAFTELVSELIAPLSADRPVAAKVRARLEALPWTQPPLETSRETDATRIRDSRRSGPSKPARSRITRRATLITGMVLAALAGILVTVMVVRLRESRPAGASLSSPGGPEPAGSGESAAPADDPLLRFRELHGRLYGGVSSQKLDGRYWIHLLVNLSRAARVPYRSLNELIDTLEKAGELPADRIRRTFQLLATGARQTMREISPRVPALLNASGSRISRSDRWMVFECLVPFLLLDRVLAVQGLADLQIGTEALLESADLTTPPETDPHGGWKQLRHYLHRPGGTGGAFESINLANAGFFPEERAAGQLDPLSHTPILQDQFATVLECALTRHDLSPGAGSSGPIALQLVSWTIMGTPAAVSDQDLVWISIGTHLPFPVHAALGSSFDRANAINPRKKPVVLSRSLPRRLVDPGASCNIRVWREVIPSAVAAFEAQTDLFIGWGRLVEF